MEEHALKFLDIPEPDNNGIYDMGKSFAPPNKRGVIITAEQIKNRRENQFTKSDMKAFGDHCRVVMNGRYSERAMDALLDTWIQNNKP